MKSQNEQMEHSFLPIFFSKSEVHDINRIQELRDSGEILCEIDEYERQLEDLFVCRFPSSASDLEERKRFVRSLTQDRSIEELGQWVYYPWRKTLVHLLNREDFVEVRTNRNKQKISQAEQQTLSSKTIGIIGLSVGQSIAISIAMERGCGKFKLADFDTVDLSNLNRLRTGVFNLGMPKVILAAREIVEIDPYIEVEVFLDGFNAENEDEFLIGSNKLDLLIEVCDNFPVKVQSRLRAREFGIPVIMETNDRGMLDIERFDLDKTQEIFHGLAGELTMEKIDNLDAASKMALLLKIVNAGELSDRMKSSLPEIGISLKSWPQLASEVVLGGAVVAWASRKLMLDLNMASGRYYVDLEKIVS